MRLARAPDPAASLYRFEGKPLGEVARLFLKNSNNFIAEALVKSMGVLSAPESGGGSWELGVAAQPAVANPAVDALQEQRRGSFPLAVRRVYEDDSRIVELDGVGQQRLRQRGAGRSRQRRQQRVGVKWPRRPTRGEGRQGGERNVEIPHGTVRSQVHREMDVTGHRGPGASFEAMEVPARSGDAGHLLGEACPIPG